MKPVIISPIVRSPPVPDHRYRIGDIVVLVEEDLNGLHFGLGCGKIVIPDLNLNIGLFDIATGHNIRRPPALDDTNLIWRGGVKAIGPEVSISGGGQGSGYILYQCGQCSPSHFLYLFV